MVVAGRREDSVMGAILDGFLENNPRVSTGGLFATRRSNFGGMMALVLVLVLNKALIVCVRIVYLGGCLALPSAVRRAGASEACENRRIPNVRRQEAQGIE